MAHRRSLQKVPPEEREQLFIEKIRACQATYDFSDPRKQFAQKEQKRQCLVDIMQYTDNNTGVFTEAIYGPLFEMFSANLFRALPVGSSNDMYYDQEDDEPFLEPSWPHLQIVYELLRIFIVSNDTDPKLLRSHITTRFVLSMVDLFDSEDPREREYLKTILHRIYGKIMQPRPFIRRSIQNVFHRFVYETHRHNGIAELLEIIGSIINGFATPLKEEHKAFLRNVLIPLHTPKALPSYHVQLSFCITQFVEKDASLAQDVVRGLVKYWPVTHSRKEVMLLNELEELLEQIQPDDFGDVIELLFRRIAKCIESPHFQVAERALFFWNNEYIVSLIVYYRAKIVPLVYGCLQRNADSHWNANVHSLSYNVQKLLAEMDGPLYEASRLAYLASLEEQKVLRKRRARRWALLEGRDPSVSSSSCSGEEDEGAPDGDAGGDVAGGSDLGGGCDDGVEIESKAHIDVGDEDADVEKTGRGRPSKTTKGGKSGDAGDLVGETMANGEIGHLGPTLSPKNSGDSTSSTSSSRSSSGAMNGTHRSLSGASGISSVSGVSSASGEWVYSSGPGMNGGSASGLGRRAGSLVAVPGAGRTSAVGADYVRRGLSPGDGQGEGNMALVAPWSSVSDTANEFERSGCESPTCTSPVSGDGSADGDVAEAPARGGGRGSGGRGGGACGRSRARVGRKPTPAKGRAVPAARK